MSKQKQNPSEILYIKETQEYIVDGKKMKSSQLTEKQKQKLNETAIESQLLIDRHIESGSLLSE